MLAVGVAVQRLAERIARRPHAAGLREARALVAHVTGLSATEQIVGDKTALSTDQWSVLDGMASRREAGEPLARIVGRAAFWDFEVMLNAATLVPRADTGVLVEAVLDRIPLDGLVDVADLGTGSGIVLLALARERATMRGVGLDLSNEAVDQARANACALGLDDRLSFAQANWLEGTKGQFDIIVSNPPYIASGEMETLESEVRLHDPALALVAGDDGLQAYRALLPQAARHVRPRGFIALEIGHSQAASVGALGKACGLDLVEVRKDLSSHDRVVVFARHSQGCV